MGSSAIDWHSLDSIAHEVGDAFYVYDEPVLQRDIEDITHAVTAVLENVRFHYAYKANPTPDICRVIARLGWGAEVDSPMLLWLARRIGVPAADIAYNGIARDPASLREALLAGALVILDADRDVNAALQAARESGPAPLRVAIRLHSATDITPMPRLGRTREQVREAIDALTSEPGIDLLGLTVHRPDRSHEGVRARLRDVIEASTEFFPNGPQIIGVGGSLIPRMSPLTSGYATSAEIIRAELEAVPWGSRVMVLMEPGTSAVANAFGFVARVVDVKGQPDRTVINVAGSINHTSPNKRRVDFPLHVISPSERRRVPGLRLVGGASAIDGDWLSVDMPCDTEVRPGDFLVFNGIGAYSISMGTHFSEPLPAVVQHDAEGWHVLRRRPTFAETFAGFDLGTM